MLYSVRTATVEFFVAVIWHPFFVKHVYTLTHKYPMATDGNIPHNLSSFSSKPWTLISAAGLAASLVGAVGLLLHHGLVREDDPLQGQGRLLEGVISHHKDLFPFDTSDYLGTLLVFFGLIIAASGGIGGGGILVPILILVFQFHPKLAIALSNFTIFGSALTNTALNFSKRHPHADRPLVDWDIILVMEPLTAAGAIIGAYMSKVLPDWFLAILLVLLLGFTSYRTINKGISQFKKETAEREKSRKNELQDAIEQKEKEIEMEQASPLIEKSKDTPHLSPEEKELMDLLEAEKETPQQKVWFLVVMFVVVIAINLLKGGGGSYQSPLGVVCGTSGYWFLVILNLVWLIVLSLYARSHLIKAWKNKRRLRYKYLEGDVEWNERNTIVYPLLCIFAGMCAGLFGVGGGIVKGPLMMEMGVHPLVAAATSSVMILFTTASATTTFIAFGTLTFDYGLFLFCFGIMGTAIGQLVVAYFVKLYNRVSLISLSVGLVVGLSTVLMAVQAIYSLATNEDQEAGTFCS
jgi:uncharacterized membrane protein YfcA